MIFFAINVGLITCAYRLLVHVHEMEATLTQLLDASLPITQEYPVENSPVSAHAPSPPPHPIAKLKSQAKQVAQKKSKRASPGRRGRQRASRGMNVVAKRATQRASQLGPDAVDSDVAQMGGEADVAQVGGEVEEESAEAEADMKGALGEGEGEGEENGLDPMAEMESSVHFEETQEFLHFERSDRMDASDFSDPDQLPYANLI